MTDKQVKLNVKKKLDKIVSNGEKELKDKKKEEEKEEDYEATAPYSLTNSKNIPIHIKPEQYSISRTLLEVYKTDEENWEPYVPNSGETEEKEEETEETEEEEEEEEEETDNEGFTLHQGEILETYYYGRFTELNTEHDYSDMNNNGSIKLPETIDLDRFYKGVRLCVRKTWEKEGETTELDDLVEILKGFITEESFAQSGMSLSISGMTKLLEQNYKFSFTQMKRSDILKEVIKTAGLKPVVNPEGLLDEVIDFTNISSDGDDEDEDAASDATNAPSIEAMVKKAIKGKKGARAKAEAIYSAMVNHLVYQYYGCSQYPGDPEAAWKDGAVNCADSTNIGCVAYRKAGLKARAIHGPNHFWCEVNIDGQWVASDVTGSEGAHCVRPLGKVYAGLTGSPCGDFSSC